MMQVIVKINGREVAQATAHNISSLADVSNYACTLGELKGPFTSGFSREFRIEGHNRRQSCWKLVQRLAEMALPN